MVNRKRVQRMWREEGLRVPAHPPKRRRVGTSTVPAVRLTAEGPNQVWAMDLLFDVTSDGRPFKVLSMCDEFTRESIGGELARSITADDIVRVLDGVVAARGAPRFIRCDIQTECRPLRSLDRPAGETRIGGAGARPPSLGLRAERSTRLLAC